MTEQNVSETTEVLVTPSDVTVEIPKKHFRFTRKQIAIATAATAAVGVGLYLKVKSSASKALADDAEDTNPESETADSV